MPVKRGDTMNIIKVDIQTGEVLENKLRQLWAREYGFQNPTEPAKANNPSRHFHLMEGHRPEKVDPTLMNRVKNFSSKINRKSHSWQEDEHYQLAVLMGREKLPYKQAGLHLPRSPDACRYMYRKMKNAGVI